MKIWLGCAPGQNGKYTASVPGLTFRNFKLYTYDKPIFNCGYNSVNFSENGFLDFSGNANSDASAKAIFVENLGAEVLNIAISQNNSDFSISEIALALAAGERKTLVIKMNTDTPDYSSTKFSMKSPSFSKSYMLKCSSKSD
jgi:hypothetical protein